MFKKSLLATIIISGLIGLVGCSGNNQEYESTLSELNELQKEYEILETDLQSSKETIENLEKKVEEAELFLNLDADNKSIINNQIEEINKQKQKELEEKRKKEEEERIRKEKENEIPREFKINMSYKVEDNGNGNVRVLVDTNLPDGTEVTINLRDKKDKYDINHFVDYAAQSSGVVKDGKFEGEWFSNRGNAIDPGTYYIQIDVSRVEHQPQEIQDKIDKWIGSGVNEYGDYGSVIETYNKK